MTEITVGDASDDITSFVTSRPIAGPWGRGSFGALRVATQGRAVLVEACYFSTAPGSSPAALSPSLRNSPPSTRSSSQDSPLIASAMSRA